MEYHLMKNSSQFALTAALMAVASVFSGGALAAAATGTANATVIAPMTITAGTALNFGAFAPTATAGSISVSNASARTSSNVVVVSSSTTTAGTFTASGDTTRTFGITYPGTFSVASGVNTMSGTMTSAGNGNSGTGTLVAGSATVSVGATLAVGANQIAGAYTGTYSLSVDYN